MTIKQVMMYVMAVFYIGAGINHFVHPDFYIHIVPAYLCCPAPLVLISGICEILIGLLLFPAATRTIGAWLCILLLIAVFPANIYMAQIYWQEQNPKLWIAIARLPIQLVLIWWAWLYTKRHK